MSKKLTEREIEVLRLLQAGLITKEIADKLMISVRTVETYRRNIHEKLSSHNIATAIAKNDNTRIRSKCRTSKPLVRFVKILVSGSCYFFITHYIINIMSIA